MKQFALKANVLVCPTIHFQSRRKLSPGRTRTRRTRKAVYASESGAPKTGSIGPERFREDAVPGTYWSDCVENGDDVRVVFKTSAGDIETETQAGDNILRVAVDLGVVAKNPDFCYEGTCELCQMNVQGAEEVGWRANPAAEGYVRTCITPIPTGMETVEVEIFDDDNEWDDVFV